MFEIIRVLKKYPSDYGNPVNTPVNLNINYASEGVN